MSEERWQAWREFRPDETDKPHGWIQWKGTNVCMDFHCQCGAMGHVDADFAYVIKCGACGQFYEMAGYVEAHPIDCDDDNYRVATVSDDELEGKEP